MAATWRIGRYVRDQRQENAPFIRTYRTEHTLASIDQNLLEQPGAATVCRRKARVRGQLSSLVTSQHAGLESLKGLETYHRYERRPLFTGESVGADGPAYKFQMQGLWVTSTGPLMLFIVSYLDAAGDTIRLHSLQVARADVLELRYD